MSAFATGLPPHRRMTRLLLADLLLLSLVLPACDAGQSPSVAGRVPETLQDAVDDPGVRLIYVPAYTYALDQGGRVALTTTLMIHNVGTTKITLRSVRYYDASGVLVDEMIEAPRELGALETVEFHQEATTTSGGAGANFLVGWTGPPAPAPLVEALMAGHQGAGRLTFTSRGVAVGVEAPEPR